MEEPGDATVMARNVKWPLSLDDKPELLRKLQESIHFEKTLTASSASGYLGHHSRLALPSSFVQRHGGKFGKSVILRTDSSAKAWPVTTDIRFMSPSSIQVKLSAGWKAFADFNGLLEGDSLIFSLTAMSEFEVYIFRSNGSATEFPTQVQRERIPDSEISQKIAAKQFYKRRNDQQSSAEESTEGVVKSSEILLVAKKEIIAEELETKVSISENVIDSSTRGRHDSKYQGPTRSKVLRKLQGSIHFEKTLTASSASGYLGRECKLALPFSFVQRHGDKFRKSATLRTESSTKAWPVSINVHIISPACTQARFGGGWRAFVDFNRLMAGDYLIFTLTAVSEFEVYIFPGNTGNPKKVLPSQLAPREWSDGSRLPRKKAKQSYECKNEQSPAEESTESAVKLRGLLVAKEETVAEELATKGSKPAPAVREGIQALHAKVQLGRKPFATFHGLTEGDWSFFSLTAISEFEVYIFPGTGNLKEFNTQLNPTKWCRCSRKKAKPAYECKNELMSAEENIEDAVKVNGWIVQKGTLGDQLAVESAFGHSPSSLRNSSHVKDSKLDKLKEPGASGERKDPGDDYRGSTLQKIGNKYQFPGFYKKLRASNIYHDEKGKKPASMEIPMDFWKTYRRRLHSHVKLQGIREDSELQTVACCPTYGKQNRIYVRAGWGDFAIANNLEVGQELLFTLTADSYFVVREVLPPPSL